MSEKTAEVSMTVALYSISFCAISLVIFLIASAFVPSTKNSEEPIAQKLSLEFEGATFECKQVINPGGM